MIHLELGAAKERAQWRAQSLRCAPVPGQTGPAGTRAQLPRRRATFWGSSSKAELGALSVSINFRLSLAGRSFWRCQGEAEERPSRAPTGSTSHPL